MPGAGVYWTAYYIVTDQLELASETGFTALKVAVAIVLGIVLIFQLPQGLFSGISGLAPDAWKRRRDKKTKRKETGYK